MDPLQIEDLTDEQLISDEELDRALAAAAEHDNDPKVVEASFDTETEVLFMKLSDGRRLFVPREELFELKAATPEQASDIRIASLGYAIWWPQIDDGIRITSFLKTRWHKPTPEQESVLAKAA